MNKYVEENYKRILSFFIGGVLSYFLVGEVFYGLFEKQLEIGNITKLIFFLCFFISIVLLDYFLHNLRCKECKDRNDILEEIYNKKCIDLDFFNFKEKVNKQYSTFNRNNIFDSIFLPFSFFMTSSFSLLLINTDFSFMLYLLFLISTVFLMVDIVEKSGFAMIESIDNSNEFIKRYMIVLTQKVQQKYNNKENKHFDEVSNILANVKEIVSEKEFADIRYYDEELRSILILLYLLNHKPEKETVIKLEKLIIKFKQKIKKIIENKEKELSEEKKNKLAENKKEEERKTLKLNEYLEKI